MNNSVFVLDISNFYQKYLNLLFAKFNVVDNINNAKLCFLCMSNTLNDDKKLILDLLDNDDLSNLSIYHVLPFFFEKYKNMKIILYYRQDSSQFTQYLQNLLIKFNNLYLMKDFLTDYINTVLFYDYSVDLLNNNQDLVKYFDKNKFIFKSTKEKILEIIKNKIFIFTIYPLQYSFFDLNKKPIYSFENPSKIYDVFFCKHQRCTYDGIGRRFLLDTIMPELHKKINNIVYFEKLEKKDYIEYLKKSKITICPYGMGEWVADDSLCPLINTLVIKPKCDEVYDYFNTFSEKKFNIIHEKKFDSCIIYCKPDYSDLNSVINEVLTNYDFYFNKMQAVKKQYYDFLQSNNWENDFAKIINYVFES